MARPVRILFFRCEVFPSEMRNFPRHQICVFFFEMIKDEAEQKTDLTLWLKMVEALRRSSGWSLEEQPVEMVQTHISVILLGRQHVVKLKKPVDFGFLDYTTLEKRRAACENEVRLNRRLCPDIYIGVDAVIEHEGEIGFSGPGGKVLDYCVRMKRLPDDRMLDKLVARGKVTESMIERVAARLAEFHQTASRGPEISKWGSLEEIRHNWEENFAQTRAFVDRTIVAADYNAIRSWVNQWIEIKSGLFNRRVSEGYVIDGHGDVRCESICVKDDLICIYDCIEFNDRFRCDDVASEAAFLAMDLDARGRPDLGYFFTESYQNRTGDRDMFILLPFYRCYRAYVRGKVLSFRLDEPEFSEDERKKAATRAAAYFELARRYASPLAQPMIIAVSGLSGTGKTSVARAIAGELGLRVVSADAIRQELFGSAKGPAAYGEGAYTTEANRQTYHRMIERGRELLAADGGVILDATFRRAEDRAAAQKMTTLAGAEWRLIECRLSPDLVRARLAQRAAHKDSFSDADWEVFLRQRKESEPLCDKKDSHCLALDTAGNLIMTSRAATDWLRTEHPPSV